MVVCRTRTRTRSGCGYQTVTDSQEGNGRAGQARQTSDERRVTSGPATTAH